MLRILVPLSILTFFLQASFSIYYSNQIVDLNQYFQDLRQKEADLQLEIQNYELLYTQSNSLQQIENFAKEQNYQKINQRLDLRN